MAAETIASKDHGTIQRDVLSAARKSCYESRDAFYECLSKESDKEPTERATVGLLYPVDCKNFRSEFEKHCRRSWVKHFDRDYCSKKKTRRLLDDGSRKGPVSLPQPSTFKPAKN